MKLYTTQRHAKILKMAESIARKMPGVNWVGSEHILLALFQIGDGLGNTMLEASGANEKAARKALRKWSKGKL